MLYSFLNDYLAIEEGSVLAATAVLVLFGVGGVVGQLLGGYLGQRLFLVDRRLQCVLMGGSTAAAVLPMILLLDGTFQLSSMMLLAATAGLLISINPPNVRSVLQDVCTPETRGTAFAFFNLTDDIGKGGGPVLVAALIRAFSGNRR
jgi:predicted MFS family arabinose efflux permease